MKYILILFVSIFSITSYAQKPDHNKINVLRIAYITEELDLTVKEAQEFWPIFNTYNTTMQNLGKRERQDVRHNLRNASQLSENEALQLLNASIAIENEKFTARNTLIEKLKGVIPSLKILKLFKAEDDFRRQLIKEYRVRRKGRQRP